MARTISDTPVYNDEIGVLKDEQIEFHRR